MSEFMLERMLHEGLLSGQEDALQTQESKDIAELRDTAEGELREQLSPNALELFETYKEYVEKLIEMQTEASCVRGLSLGIRLTAEAYSLDAGRRLL